MAEAREGLALFEGIIMGIYGNWLISAVDKITFTNVLIFLGNPLWWYQLVCMISSFASLIALLGLGVFRPRWLFRNRWVSRLYIAVLASGHLLFIYCALYVEGFSFQNFLFFVIGCMLFFLIYISELRRLRRNE